MSDRRSIRESLRTALEHHDAQGLANVFVLKPISAQQKAAPQPCSPEPLTVNGTDYSSIFVSLVNANRAADAGQPTACFKEQANVHTYFNRVFSSSDGNWLVPAMWLVCSNTRVVAMAADKEVTKDGANNAHANLQTAESIMKDSFVTSVNDRKDFHPGAPFSLDGSKKAGVLGVANELFRCYLTLNTLRLCKNLFRPIEMKKLDTSGAMGHLVTFKFFAGRLMMYEDHLPVAEENLDFAFRHCHRDAHQNKRQILRYLIPVKLLRGRYPTSQLLQKYKLGEFQDLIEATRKGDLKTFQDSIIKYQDRFINQGTYLLLEKCKTLCYRNLFRKIYRILDKHQISLQYIAGAFKWLGTPIDLDEVECILANLIYRGQIRGYLSHAKRMLVLSKRDPFPLATIVSASR